MKVEKIETRILKYRVYSVNLCRVTLVRGGGTQQ